MTTIISIENRKNMETRSPILSRSNGNWRKIAFMTIAGGLAFWLANFAISRTSLAANYRAALSISYIPMLIEALVGGLVIGFCFSVCLTRFNKIIPVNDPILKSLILSLFFLVAITVTVGNPSNFIQSGDIPRYFTIGTMINLIRISSLGLTIGIIFTKSNKNIR